MARFGFGISGNAGGVGSAAPLYEFTVEGQLLDYGLLYNGYSVRTGNLAPTGYRIPTAIDWYWLSFTLGGDSVSGEKLKSTRTDPENHPRWNSFNIATNIVNFNALGGGSRFTNGAFTAITSEGWFATSTIQSATTSVYQRMTSSGITLETFTVSDITGNSVRFLRDATVAEQLLDDGTYIETATDEDGNTYNMVKIGTQVWSAQNLKTTKYNDGTDIPNIKDNTEWTNDTTGAYCSYGNDLLSTYQDTIVLPTITVPTSEMTCTDDTLVIYNNAVLSKSAYTRSGNTYTFNFELQQGDILMFKN